MFRRTPEPPPAPHDAPPPGTPLNRRFTDRHAPSETSVGPGIHVKGTLTGSGSVEIAGTFEGPIEVDGLFQLHEGGRVKGRVSAHDAVIAGELEGSIVVSGRMELSGTARVRADIEAPTIAIAEGSVFDGRVNMGIAAAAEEETSASPDADGFHPVPAADAAVPAGAAPAAGGAVTFREKRKKKHRHGHAHHAPHAPGQDAPPPVAPPAADAPPPSDAPAAPPKTEPSS